MKQQPKVEPVSTPVLRSIELAGTFRQQYKLASQHYRSLSELFRWASTTDDPSTEHRLTTYIQALHASLERGEEFNLNLPPTPTNPKRPTLYQLCCKEVATIYDKAADTLPKEDVVQTHISAMQNIIQTAQSMWSSDDAAVSYLSRPTSLLDGHSPLNLAQESVKRAQQIEIFVAKAKQNLKKAKKRAEQIHADEPSLTVESICRSARQLFTDEKSTNEFLQYPHPLLGGQAPLELANESEEGRKRVDRLIRQAHANTAI